jgi:hypothetical protein
MTHPQVEARGKGLTVKVAYYEMLYGSSDLWAFVNTVMNQVEVFWVVTPRSVRYPTAALHGVTTRMTT